MKKVFLIVLGVLVLGGVYFVVQPKKQVELAVNTMESKLTLKSSAFKDNEFIPAKYACEGDDVNPLLEIRGMPENTKSLTLIVDDPDAPRGTWTHWLLWNINPKTQYIDEDTIPHGALQGTTSAGYIKYSGPCPPKGDKPHRYMFKLYALDTELNLLEGMTKDDLTKAMEGHIVAQTALTGLYQRK